MVVTFWDKLRDFPPCACRLLARRYEGGSRVIPLVDDEIAKKSGLPVMLVRSISWRDTWEGVPMEQVRAFTEGCGIYFEDRNNIRRYKSYIKRNLPFAYLTKSPYWKSYYEPLARAYLSSKAAQPEA